MCSFSAWWEQRGARGCRERRRLSFKPWGWCSLLPWGWLAAPVAPGFNAFLNGHQEVDTNLCLVQDFQSPKHIYFHDLTWSLLPSCEQSKVLPQLGQWWNWGSEKVKYLAYAMEWRCDHVESETQVLGSPPSAHPTWPGCYSRQVAEWSLWYQRATSFKQIFLVS